MKPEAAPGTPLRSAAADIALGIAIAIVASAAIYGITFYLGKP